jgi:hypothetical protein
MPLKPLSNFLASIKGYIMPSSVVANMKYDAERAILRVIFMSGNIYDYKNVPERVYNEMRTAGSKGTFLNKYIKGTYEFEQVS